MKLKSFSYPKLLLAFLFSGLFLLASATTCQAQAKTYTVVKDCTGIENCFTTIQAVADAANTPGDTVLIRSGTYTPFRIKYSGEENQYITFKNYPGEKPIIAGTSGQHNIVIQNAESHYNPIGWIIIDGLEIANAGNDGIKGYNVHNVVIKNCDIHHSYSNNILVTGSRNVTIDRNRLHENVPGIYAAWRL